MKITFFKGCTVVLLGFIIPILFACDPNDPVDPAPPPPPPPQPPPPPMVISRVDTLVGVYTGSCIRKNYFLNLMTGEYGSSVDSFDSELKLLGIDSLENGSFRFDFGQSDFFQYTVDSLRFYQDTIKFGEAWGPHSYNLMFVPAIGLAERRGAQYSPYGYDHSYTVCRHFKPL